MQTRHTLLCCAVWVSATIGGAASQNAASPADAAKPPSIEGRVLSLAGEPVRKAVVTVEATGAKAHSYSAVTNSEGRFSLDSVEPGDYRMVVERAGYLKQGYGSDEPGEFGSVITLAAEQRLTDLVVRLTPEASVAGRVVDEDSDPVGDVNVRLYRYAYDPAGLRLRQVASNPTDSTGAFRLSGVPPGRYHLVACPRVAAVAPPAPAPHNGEKAEYAYETTYYPGVAEPMAAQQILVSAGDGQSLGDLTLHKTRVVHVRGRVDFGAVLDARRLVIRAISTDNRSAVEFFDAPSAGLSPADGSFDLAGVTPGSYTIMVTTLSGAIKILGRLGIDVGERDVNNVAITLPPGAEVAGTIVYAGSPAPEKTAQSPMVMLIAADPGSVNHPHQYVRDGSFDLKDVNPARYRIRITGIPEDAYLQGIASSAGEDLVANDLDLTRGGGRRQITVTLKRSPARIDGSVQDGDGHHLARIVATLAPRPLDLRYAHRYGRTTSDKDGRFSLGGLPPGAYCVYLWSRLDEADEFNSELLERSASRCHPVSLQEGGHESLDLTFEPR
jgi:protocatechuate 3,4-dioxygenase beta subunit